MTITVVETGLDAAALIASWWFAWLVQSVLLTAIGLGFATAARRWGAATQSAIYRATLVAVLLAPLASAVVCRLGISGWSLPLVGVRNAMDEARQMIRVRAADSPTASRGMAPVADRQLSSASRIPIGLTGADHAADDTRVDRMQSAALSKMFESRTVASAMPATLGRVAGLAGVAWLLVSAFFLVRLARSCLALRLICRGAVAVDRPTAVLCEKLAMSFGIDCPDLRQSPFVASPCAVGILRPTILLSDDENVLDVSDVLAHELAHVARRDGLWNLLRHAATSCLFMQPLVWKLSRCIESTAEEICDDCAVELGADRIRYAEQLCSLAALSLPFRAVTAVGMKTPRTALAQRVHRILDSTRQLSTGVGVRRCSSIVASGVLITGLAGLVGAENPQPDGCNQPASAAARPGVALSGQDVDLSGQPEPAVSEMEKQSLRFHGCVLDPDGSPLAGARVYRTRDAGGQVVDDSRFQPVTTTGHDGGFTFDDSADAFFGLRQFNVVALKPGYGLGWIDVAPSDAMADLTLRIVRDDVPVEGQILDLEGRPVSRVTVCIARLEAFDNEDLQTHLTASRKGETGTPRTRAQLSLSQDDDQPFFNAVRTDRDGRFRLVGIGRDRLANLTMTGDGIEHARIQVATNRRDKAQSTSLRAPFAAPHAAQFSHHVRPARPVVGRVTDIITGVPIEGAHVSLFAGVSGSVTDASGRFELQGCPKIDLYQLFVSPPYGQSDRVTGSIARNGLGSIGSRPRQQFYLAGSATVSGTPGLDPVEVEMYLYPAVPARGRVVRRGAEPRNKTSNLQQTRI